MQDIWYSALFVIDPKELLIRFVPKHEKIFGHHSTIEFKPSSTSGLDIGKRRQIKILGRAYDDKGDALLVDNPKSKNKFPHITLSCVSDTDPVYSNELLEKAMVNGSINYFKESHYVDVIEGYETTDKKTVPDSLESFKITEVSEGIVT